MKSKYSILVLLSGIVLMLPCLSSCQDFFETDSNRLTYEDDRTISSPTDSVYSVLGILTKFQALADRYVLLGEMRADLVQPNLYTETGLRELSEATTSAENPYNNIRDYYEVINNCNYYIAKADTSKSYLLKEYAVVKGIRAWTYLQMVLNYGEVSFYTNPIVRVEEAQKTYPSYRLEAICQYFIQDLKPLKDIPLPLFGTIYDMDSKYFFVPVSLLLGDLYLWSGQYREAAASYYEYIAENGLRLDRTTRLVYTDAYFNGYANGWSSSFLSLGSGETIHFIPMAVDPADGRTSQLESLFFSWNETQQISPSTSFIRLGEVQSYKNTISGAYSSGDLRLPGSLGGTWSNGVLLDTGCIRKHLTKGSSYNAVTLCRTPHVYLRFAEACNRAGFPSMAFAVLKYGLNNTNIEQYVAKYERNQAPEFMNFPVEVYLNNIGVHSRGCGDAATNNRYTVSFSDSIPSPDELSLKMDSVENFICNEFALETAFEGNRFQDLMRIALRRNDPSFLADRIARRTGTFDATLYTRLLDVKNWYLPKK